LEPRALELMELVASEMARARFDRQLGAGTVLVGGGAKLFGLTSVAERTLGMPVRIGVPSGIEHMDEVLNDPAFAASVGLAIYGHRRRRLENRPAGGWADRFKSMFRSAKNE